MTNPVTHWLYRKRLAKPARATRGRFGMHVAEIVEHLQVDEDLVIDALTTAGYEVHEDRVDMARFYWQIATRPEPWDDATRRQHIDAIAAAWDRQLGEADVQLALRVGGELRETIRAALAPAEPTASRLAKFIRHGQARGERWAFSVTNIKPRTYATRQFARIDA